MCVFDSVIVRTLVAFLSRTKIIMVKISRTPIKNSCEAKVIRAHPESFCNSDCYVTVKSIPDLKKGWNDFARWKSNCTV